MNKASIAYKHNKSWDQAIDCYLKMYDLRTQLNDLYGSVESLVNAGKMYRHTDPAKAIETYKKAIQLYIENYRLSCGAKLWKEISEIIVSQIPSNDTENYNYEKSIEACKNANSLFIACELKLRIAVQSLKINKYKDAFEMYEEVANYYINNMKNTWSVHEYLFKSIICCMIYSHIDTIEEKFADFCLKISGIYGTREKKCLDGLINAIKEQDCEAFSTVINEYIVINCLDDTIISVLLKAKQNIQQGFQGEESKTIDPKRDSTIDIGLNEVDLS